MFSGASLGEKSIQNAYVLTNFLWVWLSVGKETVFQKVTFAEC
jgi:hypothetical protein